MSSWSQVEHDFRELSTEEKRAEDKLYMSGRRGASQAQRRQQQRLPSTTSGADIEAYTFVREHDDEGVFFYQAFNAAIADYAIANQRLGGQGFNAQRMTWIKPSFAWMLYRAVYG